MSSAFRPQCRLAAVRDHGLRASRSSARRKQWLDLPRFALPLEQGQVGEHRPIGKRPRMRQRQANEYAAAGRQASRIRLNLPSLMLNTLQHHIPYRTVLPAPGTPS